MKGIVNPDTELKMYLRLAHMQIAGYYHKFSWTMREYNLTLTDATEYNLATLIPDLVRVYKPHGSGFPNESPSYRRQSDFDIDVGGNIISITGKILKIKNGPVSGTLTIPYYSNYLVLDNDGITRKRDFESDDDTTIVSDENITALLELASEYLYRKEQKGQYTRAYQMPSGQMANITPGLYALQQASLTDVPMHVIVSDWRFET